MDRIAYIYGLYDPKTNELKYVGRTIQLPKYRLMSHIYRAKSGHKSHKSAWIRDLLEENLHPYCLTLETIPEPECYYAEEWWIDLCKKCGFNLCNHAKGGYYIPGKKIYDRDVTWTKKNLKDVFKDRKIYKAMWDEFRELHNSFCPETFYRIFTKRSYTNISALVLRQTTPGVIEHLKKLRTDGLNIRLAKKEKRRKKILEFINQNPDCHYEDIADSFNVSYTTAYQDVMFLVNIGKTKKLKRKFGSGRKRLDGQYKMF